MTPLVGVVPGLRPIMEAVIVTFAVAVAAVLVSRVRKATKRRRRRGPEIQWIGGHSGDRRESGE